VRQKIISLRDDEIVLCKHGAAALESVEDPDAIVAAEAQAKRHKTEAAARAQRVKEERDEQRRLQDVQLPGERERIDHGLKHLLPLAVMKHLSLVAHSVDGLRELQVVCDTLHALRYGLRSKILLETFLQSRAPRGKGPPTLGWFQEIMG
jgi:hypothetical protein